MFIQVLVNEQVDMGARIVDALQKKNFRVSGAFWYRMPESGFWRLVVGSKLVDRIGPLEGYRRLHGILAQMGLLALFQEAFLYSAPPTRTFSVCGAMFWVQASSTSGRASARAPTRFRTLTSTA